jgi:hypothetical protein
MVGVAMAELGGDQVTHYIRTASTVQYSDTYSGVSCS